MSGPTALRARRDGLAGFGNQARREASMWWATTRWWRQAVIWSVLLGGLLAGMLWVIPGVLAEAESARGVSSTPVQVAGQFAELAAVVSAVGVVILAQGLLLDDRRLGLTEWLLSKPLSRPALVLATLAGHASGLLFSVVLVPWLVVYALLSVAHGGPWPLGRFLGTVGLVALFVVFHLTLVLALSVLIASRGAVIAIPLALVVGADAIVGILPWTADGMPYLVNRIAAGLLASGQLLAVRPVLAMLAWALALTGLAVWRFAHTEL